MSSSTYSGRAYDELVAEGQQTVLAQTRNNWKLGDLAIEVVGPAGTHADNGGVDGGDGRLKHYADDVGIDYDQLRVHRVVATAWSEVTRVTSVPWVCYRTIYKAPDRVDTMTSFVGQCRVDGVKPSYRNFQAFLGKPVTRQYAKATARETAERALADLPPTERAAAIAPTVADPQVARQLVHLPEPAQALTNAQQEYLDETAPEPDRPTPFDAPTNTMFDVTEQIGRIRTAFDALADMLSNPNLDAESRQAAAGDLRGFAKQAEWLANLAEDPDRGRFHEGEARAAMGGEV